MFLTDPRPVAAADLTDLARTWRKLEFFAAHALEVAAIRDPRVLTSVQVDQSRPGGHRLYPLAQRHLHVAVEAHQALKVILRHHGATHVAMWCLLRAQIEASVRVSWLLESDDSRTRVSRAIHMEWEEIRTADAAKRHALTDELLPLEDTERDKALGELSAQTIETETIYRDELVALGEQPPRSPQRFSVGIAAGLINPDQPEARLLLRDAWHVLAGLQHGSVTAWLRVTDRLDEVRIPGGLRVHLAPSDDAINRYGTITASTTLSALATYIGRQQQQGSNRATDLAGIALYRQATA